MLKTSCLRDFPQITWLSYKDSIKISSIKPLSIAKGMFFTFCSGNTTKLTGKTNLHTLPFCCSIDVDFNSFLIQRL